MRKANVIAVVAVLGLVMLSQAEVPQLISYSGRLTDGSGSPVPDGAYLIKFIIWNDPLSTDALNKLWDNGYQTINTENGIFSYNLGAHTALPNNLFSDTALYLGITVGVDPEMTPRTKLTANPFSYQVLRADTAQFLSTAVTSAMIANGAIMNVDINNGADIAPSKISGTAMNLTDVQTVSGDKTFSGTLTVGDSSIQANSIGVRIGDNGAPSGSALLRLGRNYNTPEGRNGLFVPLDNSGTGQLVGGYFLIGSPSTGTGTTYGIYIDADNAASSTTSRFGVYSIAGANTNIAGTSYGVRATASGGNTAYGIYASAANAGTNFAGYFSGNTHVNGTLSKTAGAFKIDHPLEPEDKYLQHSFVESPDMKNVYDGNIITDGNGEAMVELPSYFEALNKDFRYQLTVIGEFAQAIVAEKIKNNRFVIRTEKPNLEVSWQVTGVRKDAWAEANRIKVEIDKPNEERGTYLYPELFGQPESKQLHYMARQEEMKIAEEHRDGAQWESSGIQE
ncbi:MAG: hypothetical protein AB1690_07930 [Candidatus Zixiibacteriota bacterium]